MTAELVRQDTSDAPHEPVMPPASLEHRPITQIGHYKLMEKLGTGELGNVYRARHWTLEHDVAIKLVAREVQRNTTRLEQFRREARLAAKFQHANLVNAIDVGRSETGHYFFVMEYMSGGNLQEILDSVQVFDEGQAVEIIMQVARALDYIDSRGAVHRAVHPRNIFIAPNQVAKLAGFGLARNLIDRAPTRSTARVEIEYYLSPEEARNEPTDIRSDIYSLGAILYHMVTGRPPFIGKGPVQVLARRVTDDPPHPKMFNPAISDALARILLRMLAREATERYSHPRELLEDLALLKLSGPSIELERDYEREASVSRFRGRHLPGFFRRSRGKAFSMGSFLFLGIAAAALFSSLGLGLYLFGR